MNIKMILILLGMMLSCTTYPKLEYVAIDNKGKSLTIYEYQGTYQEHQHNIGDTVVIYATYGHFGLIAPQKYDGRNLSYKSKNVIITEIK